MYMVSIQKMKIKRMQFGTILFSYKKFVTDIEENKYAN